MACFPASWPPVFVHEPPSAVPAPSIDSQLPPALSHTPPGRLVACTRLDRIKRGLAVSIHPSTAVTAAVRASVTAYRAAAAPPRRTAPLPAPRRHRQYGVHFIGSSPTDQQHCNRRPWSSQNAASKQAAPTVAALHPPPRQPPPACRRHRHTRTQQVQQHGGSSRAAAGCPAAGSPAAGGV